MKLVIAIVQDQDGAKLTSALMNKGYSVTKLATTGGFLRAGNTTLLIGVNEDEVDKVIGVIEETSRSRKQIVTSPSQLVGSTGDFVPYPMEVMVGGATVFVMDVEQFRKL